ncbi:GNAT family N-acetyltransferase [Micromonospora sp. NBC_01699]|uniref:GNAT family N-acetyltransferase n=1 Tax=Micromonospora sp. NBC_01699 TaxID=2975984 RepID=UPI002E2CEBC8|nr:GNAT family N-acetyltransferase [Micromonospora sp. NBC_01699]
MVEIDTERLVLRDWRRSDLEPWAAMNADPEVREHLGPVLDAHQAAASVESFQHDLDRNGFGFWAVEIRATGQFIGFTGLDPVDQGMSFTGVEAGWRLARPAWGHGYATEAARAALAYGFDTVGLPEILAITAKTNHRSRAVMRRLGMTTDPADDFDDPESDPGPLRRQVLYRIRREPRG